MKLSKSEPGIGKSSLSPYVKKILQRLETVIRANRGYSGHAEKNALVIRHNYYVTCRVMGYAFSIKTSPVSACLNEGEGSGQMHTVRQVIVFCRVPKLLR